MNLPASRMMPPRPLPNAFPTCLGLEQRALILALVCVLRCGCLVFPAGAAEPLHEQFEQWEPTWKVSTSAAQATSVQRERTEIAGRSGRGELIRLESAEDGVAARLSLPLPAARVLDELTISVWLRSQQPGWQLALEVVAADTIDPKTGEPARFVVRGDAYEEAGGWRQLKCRTSQAVIQQKLILLRAQSPEIQDVGQLYVDRVMLVSRIPSGVTTVHLDDLEFGPIVPFAPLNAPSPVAGLPASDPAPTVPRVEFRLDRLQVEGRPFFPRMVRYHGEPPELLRELGFNVVWIPDVKDTRLIRRLWEHGLWVTATPPRPRGGDGAPLEAGSAGLLPFDAEVDPVLFWMLGTQIPGDSRDEVSQWVEQVEFADRRRNRPIAADVAFSEQHFSRKIHLLGISRHSLQSSMSLNDYRLWLHDRRSLARPGTFCWTWLQTEPAPAIVAATRASQHSPYLEPEQLRLQAYAALAAGCRGLGFWTSSSFAGDEPAQAERRLAVRRLNLELKLLEPWLATAGNVEQIACTVASPVQQNANRNLPFGIDLPNSLERAAQLRTLSADQRQQLSRRDELTAYVLRTELGALVIPLWLEGSSQFVPAHAAVSDISLVIPGAEQAAAVTEFSTTHLRSLHSERKAGGLKVDLPMLDEIAFLWITSDLSLVERVRQRITTVQAPSASAMVELASLRLDRTGLVDRELQTLGPQQPDAPQKLGRARLRLERANSALNTGDHAAAAKLSSEVLQLLRLLQRDHWNAAVEHLSSPVSSPYTLCFQTLPDHWRLVSQFGTSRERPSRNLLPSGEFEDYDTLVAERWQNIHRVPESIQTSAALFPTGRKSRYALRLESRPQPGMQPPLVLDEPAVTVTTPAIPARAGQILHISGWVKITGTLSGSRDGVLIYDSLLGRAGGLRIHNGDQWTRFEFLRIVPESRDVTLSMSLTGLGQVLIDDLQVVPHDPRTELADDSSGNVIEPTSGSRFLDLLPKLPRMSPLPAQAP